MARQPAPLRTRIRSLVMAPEEMTNEMPGRACQVESHCLARAMASVRIFCVVVLKPAAAVHGDAPFRRLHAHCCCQVGVLQPAQAGDVINHLFAYLVIHA